MKRAMMAWLVLFGTALTLLAAGKPVSLHYMIVDMSGSIEESKMTKTMIERIKRNVNILGEQDELRVVFFNTKMSGQAAWPSMTFDAKKEVERHVRKLYEPKGETHLYDTIISVLDEIDLVATNFETVQIHILSDGNDSTKGRVRSWAPVEERACALLQRHGGSQVSFYIIGFDVPPILPERCIRAVEMGKEELVLPPAPPRARFEAAPREVLVGGEVTFFARRSPGDVTLLLWTFGDGNTQSGTPDSHDVVRHVYTVPGTYDVTLVAEGPGGRDQLIQPGLIVVKDLVRPKAAFSWAPEQPRVGQVVTLINQSTGEPESYRWTLGSYGASGEVAPTFTPTAAGEVKVALTAVRGDLTSATGAVIRVLPPAPSPAFTLEPDGEVELGQSVRAVAAERGPDVEHAWRIGGESLSGAEVTWTATVTGTIEVVHRVAGPGGKDEQRQRFYVRDIAAPEADFDLEPKRVVTGSEVTATAKQTREGVAHRWTVGDAVYEGASIRFTAKGTDPITVRHEVTARGRTGAMERSVTPVEEVVLLPRFEASTTEGHRALTVQFTDTTEGVVSAYAWDFGDGSAGSTEKNPVYTYEASGSYAVRLTVANKFGQKTTSVEPLTITVTDPPPAWLWPAIGGAVLVLGLLIAALKMRPKPPGGTIQWEDELGDRSPVVEVTGTRFSLNGLNVPGWQPKGAYVIVKREDRPVLLCNGEEVQPLGRSTRLRLDNMVFVYLNPLVED